MLGHLVSVSCPSHWPSQLSTMPVLRAAGALWTELLWLLPDLSSRGRGRAAKTPFPGAPLEPLKFQGQDCLCHCEAGCITGKLLWVPDRGAYKSIVPVGVSLPFPGLSWHGARDQDAWLLLIPPPAGDPVATIVSCLQDACNMRHHRTGALSPVAHCRYFLQQQQVGQEYAGLVPGKLSPEIRQALGIKPNGPPPWLSKMRQLGIPPDYRAKPAGGVPWLSWVYKVRTWHCNKKD